MTGPNLGWTCPQCGQVYAPSVTKCEQCHGQQAQPIPVVTPEITFPKLPTSDDLYKKYPVVDPRCETGSICSPPKED